MPLADRTHWGSLLNPLCWGQFGSARALRQPLTCGIFWARPDGCQILRRGRDGTIDTTEILGVADLDATTIVCLPQDLPAGSRWHFVTADVSHCGLESAPSPYREIVIDDTGEPYGDAPNAPYQLRVTPAAGGTLLIEWRYDAREQLATPERFDVYASTSAPPWSDAVGYVLARGPTGAGRYSYTTAALTDGQRYYVGVRASAGSPRVYSRNADYLDAVADASGPPAATAVHATTAEIS